MQPASQWETLVWPRWLPVRARLPIVAQITGAVALTALIVGPWWSRIPDRTAVPPPPLVAQPSVSQLDAAASRPAPPKTPVRPAHLNLDVRHSFGSVDLSVMVDGRPVLKSTLEGGGKRFGMFGKRAERGFTRTLDLAPGVRVVRVRLRSASDKFDQTRVERFDLASAAVAAIRIAADKSGMSVAADRPSAAVAPPAPVEATPAIPPSPSAAPQPTGTVVALLQSLRSMLIGIAGFVASTATAFVVQEFLRRRLGRDQRVRRRRAPVRVTD